MGMTINFRKCWMEVVDGAMVFRNEWVPVVLTSKGEVERYQRRFMPVWQAGEAATGVLALR